MPGNTNFTTETANLSAGVVEAGAEIERVAREQIAPAAAIIDEAFATAASSIQSNLARAAERGAFSLDQLAGALTRDLRRFAINSLVRNPVQSLVTNALTGAFGGARMGGGPVAAGQSFLVGERGPEIFTPGASGRINPLRGGGGVNVNITLPGVSDAESFRRSQSQIAAGLSRALGRGQRNL